MARRGKRTLRAVLDIRPWGGETRRGNSRYYRYLLECGHVVVDYFTRRGSIHQFIKENARDKFKVRKHCPSCALGEPMDVERLILGDFKYLPPDLHEQAMQAFNKGREK